MILCPLYNFYPYLAPVKKSTILNIFFLNFVISKAMVYSIINQKVLVPLILFFFSMQKYGMATKLGNRKIATSFWLKSWNRSMSKYNYFSINWNEILFFTKYKTLTLQISLSGQGRKIIYHIHTFFFFIIAWFVYQFLLHIVQDMKYRQVVW